MTGIGRNFATYHAIMAPRPRRLGRRAARTYGDMALRLKSVLLAAGVALWLIAGGATVQAQDQGQTQSERERAEEMARQGMERILRALNLLMDSIPQYELPEVNEKGDIIIRRKNPPPREKAPKREVEPESTDT